MSKQHTQGRLRVPDDGTVGSIETEGGTPIGHTFQVSAHDQGIGSPIRRANARRLVACWNACEGISTENLKTTFPWKSLAELYNNTINQRDIGLGANCEKFEKPLRPTPKNPPQTRCAG